MNEMGWGERRWGWRGVIAKIIALLYDRVNIKTRDMQRTNANGSETGHHLIGPEAVK
jgi:hypothetical protein